MKATLLPRFRPLLAAVTMLAMAALLVGAFAVFHTQSAQAQDPGPAPASTGPEGPEAFTSFNCTLGRVAAYEDRMDIQCTTAPPGNPGVIYFASSNNTRQSNQYLTLANTAYALSANPVITIWYESNSASNPPGCAAIDCRLLMGLRLADIP